MVSLFINVVLGMQIMNYIDIVPEIILNTFKEYPYLHSPSLEEKKEYVSWFADHTEGMLIICQDKQKLAGFITGVPIQAVRDFVVDINSLFQKHGFNSDDYYYCGDVIVLPDYQKQGVCSTMFTLFEQQVESWGYKGITLITSIREENHPLKPKEYRDSESIWQHYGFEKTSIVIKNFQPTVIDAKGTVADRENSFAFWVKKFE